MLSNLGSHPLKKSFKENHEKKKRKSCPHVKVIICTLGYVQTFFLIFLPTLQAALFSGPRCNIFKVFYLVLNCFPLKTV